MFFDPISFRFQLNFIVNTDIQQPTIIYINQELDYPHGYDINVSPFNSLTWNSTNQNYLEFKPTISTKNNTTINILLTPKTLNWFKMNISFWEKLLTR